MPTREPGVFAIPGFARLWSADAISAFGSPVTVLAVQTLVLLGLHGTATDVGVVTAARWLPYLLIGVMVGALVDRRPRLPIMVATDAALGLVLLLIPLLAVTHHLSPAGLAGVMAVVGTLTLFGDAASQSLIARWFPPGACSGRTPGSTRAARSRRWVDPRSPGRSWR